DLVVVEQRVVDVQTQHFPDNQAAAERLGTNVYDLEQPAFHIDVRFLYTRRLHKIAGDGRKARHFEFVNVGRKLGGAHVHLFAELFRHDIDHELLDPFDIAHGIFASAVGAANHGGKADYRRIGADPGEKAAWRKIPNAVGTDGRDEGDGTRYDRDHHEFIDVAVIML